jgi:hypothetical protein
MKQIQFKVECPSSTIWAEMDDQQGICLAGIMILFNHLHQIASIGRSDLQLKNITMLNIEIITHKQLLS